STADRTGSSARLGSSTWGGSSAPARLLDWPGSSAGPGSYTGLVTARGTDWGLAALVAALVASGALTLFAGSPGDTWVFAAHDGLGVAIVLLLVTKLRRVWPRVAQTARWDDKTPIALLGLVLIVLAIGSGLLWSDGVTFDVFGYSLLSVHDAA